MNRVKVQPELLLLALKSNAKTSTMIGKKLPKFDEWLTGELSPNLGVL